MTRDEIFALQKTAAQARFTRLVISYKVPGKSARDPEGWTQPFEVVVDCGEVASSPPKPQSRLLDQIPDPAWRSPALWTEIQMEDGSTMLHNRFVVPSQAHALQLRQLIESVAKTSGQKIDHQLHENTKGETVLHVGVAQGTVSSLASNIAKRITKLYKKMSRAQDATRIAGSQIASSASNSAVSAPVPRTSLGSHGPPRERNPQSPSAENATRPAERFESVRLSISSGSATFTHPTTDPEYDGYQPRHRPAPTTACPLAADQFSR